ncbi:protein FAM83F [Microcaecilia unicolor]|uniref:Protein FAM83F n=1 Tax=Microcaecilia unicolor TaxID=1415580 RepID=A0A6P7YGV8_9AMPH|nr:protein FAM83F [Microcaecilia unicolor]
MAESQLRCLDWVGVGERVPEEQAGFYYSEEQRQALRVLVSQGEQAYKEQVRKEPLRDFLSSRELQELRASWQQYGAPSPWKATGKGDSGGQDQETAAESLEYWPQLSDTEIPPLDLGWPESGFYRGMSRVLVYTHPAKENAPHIKAVIRGIIQEAQKVIAVVMDYFTDRNVFRDMVDAAYKRRVPVYLILDEDGVKYFLEMCQGMDLNTFMLRNIRVRYVSGVGFYMPDGKIRGNLSHKFLMVDGDKVAFGSFRLTWSSLRIDRNILTLMLGQNAEMFDIEFRELYAVSEEVNLYKELNIPDTRPSPRPGLRGQTQEGLHYSSTVARKLINPKYTLVVGSLPRPGEMMRWGSPRPPQSGEHSEEGKEESESAKRLDKFLNDLVTLEQILPQVIPVPDLSPQHTSKGKGINKNFLNLKIKSKEVPSSPKKDQSKNSEDTHMERKNSRRFSSGIFSRRKRNPPLNGETVVEGGFVVVNKHDPDLISLSQSTISGFAFRSTENISGNRSPTSVKSLKPKASEKCTVS